GYKKQHDDSIIRVEIYWSDQEPINVMIDNVSLAGIKPTLPAGAGQPGKLAIDVPQSEGTSASGPISGSRQLRNFPIFTQPDDISCGPTCCAMVLSYYGISAGIGPLKTKANTRWLESGLGKLGALVGEKSVRIGLTFPGKIEEALEAYGLPSSVRRANLNDVLQYVSERRPPILLVRSGKKTWHYVVAIGFNKGTNEIVLADPSGSERSISGSILDGSWQFSNTLSGSATSGRSAKVYRKVVESAGVSGHTLIVPDAGRP
ncbi:C39 family peptidase, partial [Thermodesulfobacteriota bacterium]